MATHMGVRLTSMGVSRLWWGVGTRIGDFRGVLSQHWFTALLNTPHFSLICNYFLTVEGVVCEIIWQLYLKGICTHSTYQFKTSNIGWP